MHVTTLVIVFRRDRNGERERDRESKIKLTLSFSYPGIPVQCQINVKFRLLIKGTGGRHFAFKVKLL